MIFLVKSADGTWIELDGTGSADIESILQGVAPGTIIKLIPGDAMEQSAEDYYDIEDSKG